MKKLLILLAGASLYLYGGLINGVAVVVGKQPITLLEIEKTKEKLNVNRDKAIRVLIDEKIKSQKIAELGIDVGEFELEQRLSLLAQQNNLSVEELKEVLEAKFVSWETYKSDVKKAIIDEKLSQRVLADELVVVDEDDIRIYYENNKFQFTEPKYIELTQYISTNKNDLRNFIRNPLMLNNNIVADEQNLEVANLNPKLAAILVTVKEGGFSPIFPAGPNRFFTILVKKRLGEELKDFEKVKNSIREKLNEKNRSKAIESYFLKERNRVKISYVR